MYFFNYIHQTQLKKNISRGKKTILVIRLSSCRGLNYRKVTYCLYNMYNLFNYFFFFFWQQFVQSKPIVLVNVNIDI